MVNCQIVKWSIVKSSIVNCQIVNRQIVKLSNCQIVNCQIVKSSIVKLSIVNCISSVPYNDIFFARDRGNGPRLKPDLRADLRQHALQPHRDVGRDSARRMRDRKDAAGRRIEERGLGVGAAEIDGEDRIHGTAQARARS